MNEDIDKILAKIKCRKSHGMAYQHARDCLQHIIDTQPIPEGVLIAQLKLVLGIQKRYVMEYIDSLYAFRIIEKNDEIITLRKEVVVECMRPEKILSP
jgi:hypothetical protein